jgi:subtilisin family serine protease
MIQLDAAPVVELYTTLAAADQAQSAGVSAITQAHLAWIDQAQQQLMGTLAVYDAQILYRVQRVFNGVAVYAPADQVDALAALPGVQGVYPLIPKTPSNARTAEFLHAPALWEGLDHAGLTGKGISIAIIDTGIDYLHTMFGGPGTGYVLNDTTIIGDVPNFPGAKVVGGYDFAGDSYDAGPTAGSDQVVPKPDSDPMDCYGFGHGTHVAGTAAGYGVQTNGTTYLGPYDTAIDLDTLRIGPGLAPQANLYALKVFGCSGSSNIVEAAIEWAVDPNQDGDFSDHVDVINMSLGSSFGSNFDPTTIAVENAAKLGILVVSSAGNTGDVHYAVGSPGMATRAIAVAATSINATGINSLSDGTVAQFSARGPRRGDHALKPDLTAPGVNVVSARRASGSQAVSSSGTSMSSPVVAGIMALLRQAHPESGAPGWQAQELKALVMNTATYPLERTDVGSPFSLLRVGAGRIDPVAALQSNLIAYDAAAPEQVSMSFGMVEVLDHVTVVRAIRVANKTNVPISVTVGYTVVSDLPGVTIDVGANIGAGDVGAGEIITLPAGGFATVPVTLTASAASMTRRPDPARQVMPPDAYPWVDEAGGYAIFTPVVPTNGPAIHLPILALPRTVSALSLMGAPIDLAATTTATFPLTLTGSALTNVVAPTATVPLMGLFALAHSSPPITAAPDDDPVLGNYAQADLRYVGTAGPVLVDDELMLYFALVTYGPWSTPLEVTFQIKMDIDGDQLMDYRLQNREKTDVGTFDFATTDDFVSLLESSDSKRIVQGQLNLFPATRYDTRLYASNIVVLPLRLHDLGANVNRINYQVVSYSHDTTNSAQTVQSVDQTPILSVQLNEAAITQMGSAEPLFPAAAGDVVNVTFDRAAFLQQQSQGLLALYLHNELATRTQVFPVAFDFLYKHYLPRIRGD